MVRIELEPEMVSLSKNIEDPGYIILPEKIFAYDIMRDAKSRDEKLTAAIQQFENKYNFYFPAIAYQPELITKLEVQNGLP